MKVYEKKDCHALKRIYIGREIIQKEFPFHPPQSIHVHILIWLYDLISLWIQFLTLQYMWYKYALYFMPYLELHI